MRGYDPARGGKRLRVVYETNSTGPLVYVRLKERTNRIEIALFAPDKGPQTADSRTRCIVMPLNESLGTRKLIWIGTRQPRRERQRLGCRPAPEVKRV